MANETYCIDASSLINLKQYYRRKVFSGLWDKIEDMVRTGRLIAPDEVRREIEKDDLLGPWAKKNKKMFRNPDQEQMNTAKDVIKHFPNLAKPGKFGPAADPFVVALANLEERRRSGSLLQEKSECVVVTNERRTHGIPVACKHYNIECVTLVDLFDREGWEFVGR